MKKGEAFRFGPWTVSSTKGPILTAKEVEKISEELELPSIPEMVFGKNQLQVTHEDGFGIQFNAVDALKKVDNKHDLMKVAVAEEWQSKRQDSEYIREVVKPFDWTYSTDYTGTLIDQEGAHLQVLTTDERINIEKLKVKEKIHFYDDIVLFEDELADNGVSRLNVKIRVMPSSFFILLRFYLRVDGVLVRVNDTRIFHEAGTSYFLREFSSKEKRIVDLKFVGSVEQMEKVVMVPNRLQDLTCNQSLKLTSTEDHVTEHGLHDSFRILRNLKNELQTGHSLECGTKTPFYEQLQALNILLQDLTSVAVNLTTTYKEDYKLIM